MIKLVGIDFDGTLLNSKKEISKKNKEAIKKVIDKNVIVSIFTGRNYTSAIKYIQELELDVVCVFQNGALIIKPLSKEIVDKNTLSKDKALQVCKFLKSEGIEFAIFTDFFESPDMIITKKIVSSNYAPYFKNNSWRSKTVEDVYKYLKNLQKDEIVQIAFVSDYKFIQKIKEKFKEVSIITSTEINGEYFTEVFGKNVGKEKALEHLEKYYNISPQETMFIGDGFNDLEIIKKVKYGVAMGNAKDEIKKFAKYVTLENDSDGVAHILQKLVLQ
jgi:Cof subfamily protein (haloacid dehalogenase superfamily)